MLYDSYVIDFQRALQIEIADGSLSDFEELKSNSVGIHYYKQTVLL